MQADRDGTRTRVAVPGFHEETQDSRVAASLHRVREIAVAEHRDDLAAAIDEELKHIARASAVTVVVAAEVSRGKSLLINALLEKEGLLPVDIDVSTGVYVLVQHGESAAARVFTRTSREPITISLDALGQWVSVAGNPGNASDVAYVEVDVPAPLLGEGLSFIDTPGVGGLDAAHGRTTLAALSDADALIFVLDASAPLSRPELRFLSKASQRIESVILVLTKTDVFPGWRTILDENRQLLQQFAPRFADHEIIPVRSPLVFAAMRRQAAGDAPGADRLLGRSGIPLLVKHLREDLLQRSGSIRTANAHRLALSVLWQLDDGYKAQLATLSGDTSPLRALQDRQRELAEQKSSAERWRKAAAQGFNDVDVKLTRELQEAIVDFRNRFDTEIATAWRPGRQLSFPAELEADLRLVEIALQRRLAECLRECAGQQAARLRIDEFSAPVATLALPIRDRLDVHPVHRSAARFAVLGGQMLSRAVGLLRWVSAPTRCMSSPLGFSGSPRRWPVCRASGHNVSASNPRPAGCCRRTCSVSSSDCKAAIDEAVQSATDTTIEALQAGLGSQLQVLQVQIQDLTKRAAEVKEAEAAKALLEEKRAVIATLEAEHQVAFRGALSVARGSASAMTPPEDVSSAGDYGMTGQGDS